jgi:hypothetical protein
MRHPVSAVLRGVRRVHAALPRAVAAAAAGALMACIFWLSSGPLAFLPPGDLGAVLGNSGHGPLYGLLAVLAARAVARSPEQLRGNLRPWALGFAIAVLYGATDEWHQAYVPGRSSSVFDVATDAIGAACAFWVLLPLPDGDTSERTARRRLLGSLAAVLASGTVASLADWYLPRL